MSKKDTGEIALMWIICAGMIVLAVTAVDCSLYIWFHPDLGTPDQRCGSNNRKDLIQGFKEVAALLLAFLAGKNTPPPP